MKNYRYEITYKGVSSGSKIKHHSKKFTVSAPNAHDAVHKVRDMVSEDPLFSRLFYPSYVVNLLDH